MRTGDLEWCAILGLRGSVTIYSPSSSLNTLEDQKSFCRDVRRSRMSNPAALSAGEVLQASHSDVRHLTADCAILSLLLLTTTPGLPATVTPTMFLHNSNSTYHAQPVIRTTLQSAQVHSSLKIIRSSHSLIMRESRQIPRQSSPGPPRSSRY